MSIRAATIAMAALACPLCGCQVISGAGDYRFSGPETTLTTWALSFGDDAGQSVNGVAIDTDRSVIVAGAFGGSVDFGDGEPLLAVGAPSFVARYDELGGLQQVRSLGGGEPDVITDVEVGFSGEIYVVGVYTGSFNAGNGGTKSVTDNPGTGSPRGAIFLAQLTPSLEVVWVQDIKPFDIPDGVEPGQYGNAEVLPNPGLAVSPLGPVVAFELRRDTVTAASTPFSEDGATFAAAGLEDLVVIQYDAAGSLLWDRHFPSTLGDEARLSRASAFNRLVAAGLDGSVVVGGVVQGSLAVETVEGTTTLDCVPPAPAPDEFNCLDGYLIGLAPDGSVRFINQQGGNRQLTSAVGVDPNDGTIFLGGLAFLDFALDGGAVQEDLGAGAAQFVAAFSPDGDYDRHRSFAASANIFEDDPNAEVDLSLPVSLDTAIDGSLLLSGVLGGTLDAGIPLTGNGGFDVYVIKLSPELDTLVASNYGDSFLEVPYDAALDSAGHIIVGGAFTNTMQVGTTQLQEFGAASGAATFEGDGFVMKLLPE